jgi:hypothetical protein
VIIRKIMKKIIIAASVILILCSCNGAGTDQPAVIDTSGAAKSGNIPGNDTVNINKMDTARGKLNAADTSKRHQ